MLDLRLDLRPHHRWSESSVPRSFGTILAPVLRGSSTELTAWRLRALVRPYPVVASADEVDFADSLLDGSRFAPRCVQLRCMKAVKRFDVASEPDHGLEAEVRATEDRQRYELRLVPCSNLSPGEHWFVVRVQPHLAQTDPAWPSLPPLRVRVRAVVQTDVYAMPSPLCFGAVEQGICVRETVSLGSRSGKSFRIVQVNRGGQGNVRAEQPDGIARPRHAIEVAICAERPGEATSNLEFVVAEPESGKTYSVPLSVTYRGLVK